MNNTILLKGTDFSEVSAKKLNIQKLNITKAGNGFKRVVNESVVDVPDNAGNNYYPSEFGAHSAEITIPSGYGTIYGMTTIVGVTTAIDNWLQTPSATSTAGLTFQPWLAHSTDNYWGAVGAIHAHSSNIKIISRKDGIFNGKYTIIKFIGPIYDTIQFGSYIDKMIINWVRDDSVTLGEIGISVPEIYVGTV